SVGHGLPPLDDYGVACNRLNGDAQRFLYLVVRRIAWNADIVGADREYHAVPVVANHLDGILRTAGARGLIAEVPEMRSDEDKEQDQRHHHVVVKGTPVIGPVEVAFEYLADSALRLLNRAAGAAGFHLDLPAYCIDAAHVRTQNLGDKNCAVRLLVIFNHRDP